LLIVVVIGCLAVSALCAAAGQALAEASRAKLDDLVQGEARARMDRRLERDPELALSSAIGRAVFETGAVCAFVWHLSAGGHGRVVTFLWAALIVVVVSEVVPRLLAVRSPEAVLLRTLPVFYVIAYPLLPVAGAARRLAKFARPPEGQTTEEEEAADDILSAVTEGEKEGSIAGEQADMIENIIELRDTDVAEIMTPRLDMTSVDLHGPLEKTIQTALESGHSRLPVYRGTRDDIVGILYVRDLVAARVPAENGAPALSTEKLMRPPYFVPETMRISDLLRQFQERRATLAIVVDEYGGTAGLVTIGDIMDAIVGEVRDHDEPQREPVVNVADDHTLEADARTPVRRLNEDFGTSIPESDEYDTVGGYLCCTLGRVPKEGDRQRCDNTDILVLAADPRHVEGVRITVTDGVRRD